MTKKIIKISLFLLIITAFCHLTSVYAEVKYVDSNFTCSAPEVYRAMGMVGRILLLLRILIPVVIVVVSLIHFTKSVLSQEDTDIQKLFYDLVKKVVIGMIVFFTPAIVLAISDAALSKRSENMKWELCVEALQKGKLEQDS